MNNDFPKNYQNGNEQVNAFFETLPKAVQEMIMQDNKNFETVEELKTFADNITGK